MAFQSKYLLSVEAPNFSFGWSVRDEAQALLQMHATAAAHPGVRVTVSSPTGEPIACHTSPVRQ